MKLKNIIFAVIIITISHLETLSQTQDYQEITAWKYKIFNKVIASPVIYNNILYIGAFDSSLYALDASTGNLKWKYKATGRIYTSVVNYKDLIYFESRNILYAVNVNGDLAWKFNLYDGPISYENDTYDYYRSSPALYDSTIYIGSEKGKVYGFNANTGVKTFECQTPSGNFTIETTPSVYNNKVYFGDWNGVFYVYDLNTASLVWSYDTKIDNIYSNWTNAIVTDPIIQNGNVYFGGRSCNLYCLDAENGDKKWSWHDGGNMWVLGGPAIVDGILYTGSSFQHVVRAYKELTGELLWSTLVAYRVTSKPLIYGDFIIAGTTHDSNENIGDLTVIYQPTASVISKIDLQSQVYSSPLLYNGYLYFCSYNGNIYAQNVDSLISSPIMALDFNEHINLGKIEKSKSADTTIVIYNKGSKPDSISISCKNSAVNISPSDFVIAPNDSQQVNIEVYTDSLNTQGYSITVSFISHKAVPAITIKKKLVFGVVDLTNVKNEQKGYTFYLGQNYPNPFNPETVINYEIPTTGIVQIKIYDILGNEVATLVNEEQAAGKYNINFSANYLSSGIYFYCLRAGNYVNVKKMTLLR